MLAILTYGLREGPASSFGRLPTNPCCDSLVPTRRSRLLLLSLNGVGWPCWNSDPRLPFAFARSPRVDTPQRNGVGLQRATTTASMFFTGERGSNLGIRPTPSRDNLRHSPSLFGTVAATLPEEVVGFLVTSAVVLFLLHLG